MALATREIKRRIRSVANTKKITKAMEMVAAAKMRKAVSAVLRSRHYAQTAWEIVKDLSIKTDSGRHPLLVQRSSQERIGIVLMASQRGLCGSFNRDIVETTVSYLDDKKKNFSDVQADIFLVGNKGKEIGWRYGYNIAAEFEKNDTAAKVSDIRPLAKMVIAGYISGKYDQIVLAYTDYHSAISQEPRVRKLLPITSEDDELGYVKKTPQDKEKENSYLENDFIFEPSPDVVLEQMLYRLIELQIYQALLEANASEHSARMMAMRNASDAANDMIDDLTMTFNRARQQNITSELADISAGRAAVE